VLVRFTTNEAVYFIVFTVNGSCVLLLLLLSSSLWQAHRWCLYGGRADTPKRQVTWCV